MRATFHEARIRRQGGFIGGKLIGCVVVCFALYSGCAYFPAYMKQQQLEGAIQNVLDHGNHKLQDDVIQNKAMFAVESMELPLTSDMIQVRRERSEGVREIHVEFEMPVTVSYLGSDRVVTRQVHVEKAYEVDETTEARLVAQREEKRRRDAESERILQADRQAHMKSMKDACTKGNSRDVYTTHVWVTHPDGEQQIVDCAQVALW